MHVVDEHQAEPYCGDCGESFGAEAVGEPGGHEHPRYPAVRTYLVSSAAVSFAAVDGAVIEFDDVRIDEAAIVCARCVGLRKLDTDLEDDFG